MPATSASARRARREQLRDLLRRHDLRALVLGRPPNFAWYTGGADNRVNHVSPVGVASIVITAERECILTSTIEAPRMRAEEAGDLEVVDYPWEQDALPALRQLTGAGAIGADHPLPGARDLSAALDPLRYVLDGAAIAQYQEVGAAAMDAVAEATADFAPGITENAALGALLAALRRRGLACPVALAAADERIARFRHPVAGDRPARQRLMVVVCAERHGLYANLTRIIEFTPPADDLARRQARCDTILRRMREEATRPGGTLADAFADCRRFYADAGYPDEWRLHHQGGLSGYASREVVATSATHQPIQVGQAFAWNPSITGAKAEETFILTEQGPLVVAR
ncbi:MAG TPA: M24 family metallopeptidase [Ktedonobacterales bacterium]